jgi:hypothetical protein
MFKAYFHVIHMSIRLPFPQSRSDAMRWTKTQLVGLTGVVKISHIVCNGTSLLGLDDLAAAGRREELSPANLECPSPNCGSRANFDPSFRNRRQWKQRTPWLCLAKIISSFPN